MVDDLMLMMVVFMFGMACCSAGQVVVSSPVWSVVKSRFDGSVLPSGRVVVKACNQPLSLRNLKRTPYPEYESTVRTQLRTCSVLCCRAEWVGVQ